MEIGSPTTAEQSAGTTHDDPVAGEMSARIGLQIEPTAPGGPVFNRQDFLIRGRVVSTVALEEIRLLHDGVRVGQILLGQGEPTAQVMFPDGMIGAQHNFVLTLPIPQASAIERGDFAIGVRTFDNNTAHVGFVLQTDPANAPHGLITAGPTEEGVSRLGAPPSILMYTERAAIDPDGMLHVHGWAVSRSTLVTVQIFADDERIGSAQLGGRRDDIARQHPHYPNARLSGFTIKAYLGALASKVVSVRAQALTLTGSAHEVVLPVERLMFADGADATLVNALAEPPTPNPAAQQDEPIMPPLPPVPASDPRRAIKAFCDELALGADGVIWVSGWVVCPAGIASLTVLLDGQPAGEAELGLLRKDVGDAYPAVPSARYSGFRLQKKVLDTASGEHTVTIVMRNGMDDLAQLTSTVVAGGGRSPAAVPAEPAGHVVRASADGQHFKFQLDNPPVAGGAATDLVTGRMTIEGWVLARTGVESIEIFLDDQRLGSAHYGLARQDVGQAFPDWTDSLRSGYAFHCPPRSLRDGEHTITLHIRAKTGEALVESFRINVEKSAESNESARIRRRVARAEAELYDTMLRRLDWQPRFRLLLRGDDTAPPDQLADRLTKTLVSLERQIYPHWRVEMLDDDPALRMEAEALEASGRIAAGRIGFLDAAASATAFGADPNSGPTTLVGVLSCGDELGCDALAEMAMQSGLHREAELLYADEVRTIPGSSEREAFFKPGFSPDLLLSTNYIGRPWFATAALLGRAGASPRSLSTSGEYDLLLRCVEQANAVGAIRAVPRLLCERDPATAEPAASERQSLARAASRRGIDADVLPGCLPGTWRLKRRVKTAGKVSIIIPTCAAQGFIRTCLATLATHTGYRNFEVVAIDNIPPAMAEEKAWLRRSVDKIVDIPEAFNWSRFNNRAVEAADGEFLLFLNDDIEMIQEDWLDALLEHAQRPEVGIVGPQLLYPDGKVQHAGMFLAGPGLARHAFRFAAADEPGYFGLARTQRNVMAVTGACMLVRRETFDALGGFDEAHEVINNDLDFCLRAHEAGLLTVFTPHATLIHHELASRANIGEVYNLDHFQSRWRMRFVNGDPYYSPNLSKNFDDYRPNDEPVHEVFSGHPLFWAEDIRRILVVKVDHIGDFITALPAIRRLKAHFPLARIAVLASRTVRKFADLDPAIDEIIDFDYFHARSALGRRDLEPDELAALTERLAPYGFDLAIDLRKHLDTRELLRCSGAAVTVGFDYMGQFPWLDISLEWEGDRGLHPKRYHVTDDLLHLVDTVATAAQPDRTGILPEAIAALRESADIPPEVRDFLSGPVVCVHAGAGNEMKQWPETYFTALIDMLITRNCVRVLLIGGPDEVELEQRILASVENRAQVMSLVGKVKLQVLPAVMAACALYVGNDSGPKHIAASVGIPTIGVHSGTVDPIEWAPMGPHSVAIARAMSCSPCYLNRLADCPRGLACMRQLEPHAVHRMCEMMLAGAVRPERTAKPTPERRGKAAAAPKKRTRSARTVASV